MREQGTINHARLQRVVKVLMKRAELGELPNAADMPPHIDTAEAYDAVRLLAIDALEEAVALIADKGI